MGSATTLTVDDSQAIEEQLYRVQEGVDSLHGLIHGQRIRPLDPEQNQNNKVNTALK